MFAAALHASVMYCRIEYLNQAAQDPSHLYTDNHYHHQQYRCWPAIIVSMSHCYNAHKWYNNNMGIYFLTCICRNDRRGCAVLCLRQLQVSRAYNWLHQVFNDKIGIWTQTTPLCVWIQIQQRVCTVPKQDTVDLGLWSILGLDDHNSEILPNLH